jgi:hypothetical protein
MEDVIELDLVAPPFNVDGLVSSELCFRQSDLAEYKRNGCHTKQQVMAACALVLMNKCLSSSGVHLIDLDA